MCLAAACGSEEGGPTVSGTGGAGQDAGTEAAGLTGGSPGDAAPEVASGGEGGEAGEGGTGGQGGEGINWCMGNGTTELFAVVRMVDDDCDGNIDQCYRYDEAVLGSGATVRYATYESCDTTSGVAESALMYCNSTGTFLSVGWDTNQDGIAEKACEKILYGPQGEELTGSYDFDCNGVPDICFANTQDDKERRIELFTYSGCSDRSCLRESRLYDSEWQPPLVGDDTNCDALPDTNCHRNSWFFPGLRAVDLNCDGAAESGCERIYYNSKGCPAWAVADPKCNGGQAGCAVAFADSAGCKWLSVGADSDCDGVPDGRCRYIDRNGPQTDWPTDVDCKGCRVEEEVARADLRVRWRTQGVDSDCDGYAESHCEVWLWTLK